MTLEILIGVISAELIRICLSPQGLFKRLVDDEIEKIKQRNSTRL
jgi:hypothetical protein